MVVGSAGTGITSPSTVIVPLAVPKAMVLIFTPAALADEASLRAEAVGEFPFSPMVG
jgi:hypothetical protein